MNQKQFRELHFKGRIHIDVYRETNNLRSATDPTQDVPVRNIQFMANGDPINVIKRNLAFNGLNPDQLTTIEKRHSDPFDVLGELQARERGLAGDIAKYKQFKKQKENEN